MANDTSGSGLQPTELPRRRTGPGARAAVLPGPVDGASPGVGESGPDRRPRAEDEPVRRAEPGDPDPAGGQEAAAAEDRSGVPAPRGGIAGGSSPRPPSAMPTSRRIDVEPTSTAAASGSVGPTATDQRAASPSEAEPDELPAPSRGASTQNGSQSDGDEHPPVDPGDPQGGASGTVEPADPTPAVDSEPPEHEPQAGDSSQPAPPGPVWDWTSLGAAAPVAPAPESSSAVAERPSSAHPLAETDTDPNGLMWQRYFAPMPAPTMPRPASAARPARRGVLELAAVALVSALLGGAIGGAAGFTLAGGRSGDGDTPSVLAQPLPGPASDGAVIGPAESVAAKVLPSVVQLRVDGASSAGEGSGMVLSPDGLLLTNNHVVESAARGGKVTAVFQDGATAPVDIIGRDPSFDIAVMRARDVSGLTPIELGNSDTARVGQQVVAFGSPLGLGGTVTTGIISAINRPVSVGGDRVSSDATVLNALQTDAAINPGNSGGPLVDMHGQLIGINSAIATTGAEGGSIGVGFAIPVNQAKRVADELQRTGKASRAQLGVSVGDDPNLSGARIRSVDPGSAAERAGLRAGDLVIRFGGQRIMAGEGLQAAVRSRAPRETVEVELPDRTLSVTLGP
jgi:putative serine protease PepD